MSRSKWYPWRHWTSGESLGSKRLEIDLYLGPERDERSTG